MPRPATTVQIDGRTVRLTSLDRVLYPSTGTTKADIVAYYSSVGQALLRQLQGRPVTRKRWPDGVAGPGFMEKNAPRGMPDWVPIAPIPHRGEEGLVNYVLVDEVATLVWLAQTASLELHSPQWRLSEARIQQPPDRLVIDLDPGVPAGLLECAEVALACREVLKEVGLTESLPVLSGSKGIHIYAHLPAQHELDVTKAAHLIAQTLEARLPTLVLTTMRRDQRAARVFVDWSQNSPAKTTVTPYSLRGRARPTVAAPVTWDELVEPGLRQLEHAEVAKRLSDLGDLMDF